MRPFIRSLSSSLIYRLRMNIVMTGILCCLPLTSAQGLELGACESERGKLVFILKHVFQPYLHAEKQLSEMRRELLDLSNSLDGWVEDIDNCYREVFGKYRAPVNNSMLNDSIDWSMQMLDLKQQISQNREDIEKSPQDALFWSDLDSMLQQALPLLFAPNKPYQSLVSNGGHI